MPLQILLLCGPAGLGKTTLAYVLARQAGYQVLEVNASDDRSGKIVEDRIRNALESRALTMDGGMAGNKPTCVVIDEIDGAGGGGESASKLRFACVSGPDKIRSTELRSDIGQARQRWELDEKVQRWVLIADKGGYSLTSCFCRQRKEGSTATPTHYLHLQRPVRHALYPHRTRRS